MKQLKIYTCVFLIALLLSGCAPVGLIYTHTRIPLDTNMNRTPVIEDHAEGHIKHLSIPLENIGNSGLDIFWSSNAIGDIALEHGISSIYFSDLEILRVLYVWNQYTVHVYGK